MEGTLRVTSDICAQSMIIFLPKLWIRRGCRKGDMHIFAKLLFPPALRIRQRLFTLHPWSIVPNIAADLSSSFTTPKHSEAANKIYTKTATMHEVLAPYTTENNSTITSLLRCTYFNVKLKKFTGDQTAPSQTPPRLNVSYIFYLFRQCYWNLL